MLIFQPYNLGLTIIFPASPPQQHCLGLLSCVLLDLETYPYPVSIYISI